MNQIVIFTGTLDFNVRWNVIALSEKFPETRFTIFLHAPEKGATRLLYNQFRNLKRHGWRWVPYQFGEIVRLFLVQYKSVPAKSVHRPGQMFDLIALEKHPKITIKPFADINGSEACKHLRQLFPDLGISLAAPILKKALFSIPRLGTINLHKGRLPDFRGMPPAFWELKQGEKEVGCTVHKVDAGLDSGPILLQSAVAIEKYSTVDGVQAKLHHLGVNMVCDAVNLIAAGMAEFAHQSRGGKTNTRPTLADEQKLRKLLKSKEPSESGPRTIGKRSIFFTYSHIYKPLLNRLYGKFCKQRVIILLYHRVSDQFRDSVTVGIEQFERQMAYVSANYNTISLEELVNGQISRSSSKPVIAVTFDDGYLDNFENAAPILLKHQIPCTLFISTRKIAHNLPFEHDLKALGFGLDNMNWKQISLMHKWGFHFGSHTLNHVNLAAVSDEAALHELTESLNDIRTNLGQEKVLIAYPFGRKHHITPERIEMIKQAGYSACCSAYGGYNDMKIDLFNIKRVGINWAFDMMAFKARLNGWDNTI